MCFHTSFRQLTFANIQMWVDDSIKKLTQMQTLAGAIGSAVGLKLYANGFLSTDAPWPWGVKFLHILVPIIIMKNILTIVCITK